MAEVQFNGANSAQTPVPLTAEPAPQQAEIVPIKRGPGRPRKNPLPADAAAPVKRGPGRPRKNPATTAAAPVKRGPGRPRKNPVDTAAAPVKRGPGRPRKNPVEVKKKEKRVAGIKAQTQIPKPVMKFFEQTAKEQGGKASALMREVLVNYATRRGVELGT